MTNASESTAAETCAKRRSDIARLLDVLDMELEKHEARTKADPKNWGLPGDLGKVRSDLMDTVAFISGTDRAEVEHGVGHDGEPMPIRETLRLAVAISGNYGRRAVRGAIVAPDGRDLTPRLNARLQPEPAPHLVRAIGQAFAMHAEAMRTGTSIERIARAQGMHEARARQLHVLTRLSPAIIKATLTGTLPRRISLMDLRDATYELDWSRQVQRLAL